MATKEVKDLFWKLGQETLQEERFKYMKDGERWANFVRENPTKWKKFHTEFINALFQKNEEVTRRILQRHHKWDLFTQEPKEVESAVVMVYNYEKQHSQVPYKLDPNIIRKLEEGEPVF